MVRPRIGRDETFYDFLHESPRRSWLWVPMVLLLGAAGGYAIRGTPTDSRMKQTASEASKEIAETATVAAHRARQVAVSIKRRANQLIHPNE